MVTPILETIRGTSKQRPAKRRQITKSGTPKHQVASGWKNIFVPLLNGAEELRFVKLRHATYQRLWSQQERVMDDIVQNVNSKTARDLAAFVKKAKPERYEQRIPTALLVAGPGIAAHGLLFQQLARRIRTDGDAVVVLLHSTDATNLKGILKHLIRAATSQPLDPDGEEVEDSSKTKRLSYDLDILACFVRDKRIRRVVVSFQDSEAFDSALLADLISLLRSWLDRIPLVLLFGIATSVEIFHEKLSRAAIQCMHGQRFEVNGTEDAIERVFSAGVGPPSRLRLGPALTRLILGRQKDHNDSASSVVGSLKYAYMSHFYANPLSILLVEDDEELLDLQPLHLQAIRHLPSFQQWVEDVLDQGDGERVQLLLTDDAHLLKTVLQCRKELLDAAAGLLSAVDFLRVLFACFPNRTSPLSSELYAKAVAGEMMHDVVVRDLFLSIKKMPSDALAKLLETLTAATTPIADEMIQLQRKLHALHKSRHRDGQKDPLRSEHDLRHNTLRTTVIAQRVEISKQRSALSADDLAYSKIVHDTHDLLYGYLTTHLQAPHERFLHEIFFYDLRSPYRDVFAPRLRPAIERALASPQDYLNCTCCAGSSEGLSSTLPPTAILYQLYLESGAFINVYDMWRAFYTIVAGEDGDDCDETSAMALFSRALADLRHLGMIKHSRKKTDHVAKLAWKGL
ncbi:MAG: hypothetical protein M1838_001962 [Thelocarpon superellum]|nr:MAG: hypothetical protein M1838_001962 [Thelocarpon superellum]